MVDDADLPLQPPGQPDGLPVASDAVNVVPLRPRAPSDAQASASGDGAGAGSDKARPAAPKKERTVDWGKFNYLVENFALIYGTDQVWDGCERIMMKLSAMSHAHGSELVKMWKGSEKRRTVRQCDVVFDPTEQADPETTINLFSGFELVPVAGDVVPILDLVRFLTSRVAEHEDECEEIMHWLLCWLAYPLQHPGAKLRTSLIFHGDEGAGKNFLFDVMVSIYGAYGVTVGQDELESDFNDWRSGKLLVVGDEVSSRAELVHNKNRLKQMITSEKVQINPKNLTRREEKNHMNVVFLSNELTPLALDNSDRRYLVVYTPKAREPEFYQGLGRWRAGGGAAAFYHFLLEYPLNGFDPFSPAPLTQAKLDLIDINRKSPELFWLAWSEGEIDLPYHSCEAAQAYQAYLKWCQRTGDRFPLRQNICTRLLQRMADTHGRPVQIKVMKLDDNGVKRAKRMLLVTPLPPLPPDETEGQWATETAKKFEECLRKYMGRSYMATDGAGDGDE